MLPTAVGHGDDARRLDQRRRPAGDAESSLCLVFFVVYIVITTFMVLNLFIGVVVNAMQEEASKADAEELAAEREIIQEQAAPILAEVRSLRTEVAQLRAELAGGRPQTSG
jgi:voltage-gated sodium channel